MSVQRSRILEFTTLNLRVKRLYEDKYQETFQNADGQSETRTVHRDTESCWFIGFSCAVGTYLDMRLYLEEKDADHRECELHRFDPNGVHVPWPRQGLDDYNYWFNCTIRHRLFTLTSFLRQPSHYPAPDQVGVWPVLQNGQVLPASGNDNLLTTCLFFFIVALIMRTNTPKVKTSLGLHTTLDCHFVIDHDASDYTVEWASQIDGETRQLFSHNTRSGLTLGTGVDLKALQKGNASYGQPAVDRVTKGTFTCSMSVDRLVATLRIDWTIEVRPKVSINVGSILLLAENSPERAITCIAEDFYPENVEVLWTQIRSTHLSQLGRGPVPAALSKNVRVVGSEANGTLSMIANLDLHPLVKDSGTQFTCSVFHQSLRVPIRRSFIIYVEGESSSWYSHGIIIICFSTARRWLFRVR
uniref:Ig-like domain-containing protein n=1 Tax=Salarias fasciatus TaxID=181472 RepID=A0A672JBZ2_SALFA